MHRFRSLALAQGLALLACLAAGCAHTGRGGPRAEAEVDALGLAALLIRDGHYARAGAVLEEVDPQQEDVDASRYHTLRGLVALHAQEFAVARDALRLARVEGAPPMLGVYLAQAHYGLGDYAGTLEALDTCRTAWAEMPDVYRLVIHCHWQRKEHAAAFAALDLARGRFPEAADLAKQRVLYLLELGLNQAAAEAGRDYLACAGRTAQAYLTLGEALRRGGQPQASAEVLEGARLRFPGETQVLVALAHAHLDAERPRAAAGVMEEAARLNPKYMGDAAELYRRAGDTGRALFLNLEMTDQRTKARQRLSILLQRGQLEQAAALEPRLRRLGMLEDEEICYALAYAHFRSGDLERAAARLRGITRQDLFQSATELRKAIEVERAQEGDG